MKIAKFTMFFTMYWIIPGFIAAQNYTDDFGTIKMDQLTMASYDRDNLAEAVVMYDIGNAYFVDNDNGFRIVFERGTKVKILAKAGLKYASVEIPFYVETAQIESVYDIEGYTYNIENGVVKKTKLDVKSTFEEKISEHWMVKKFAMPDVKEGSVIEYRYKINSPYFFNFRDWEFQGRIPVIYSEYTVRMIPFYEYSYIFQGASKFDVYKNIVDNTKRRYGGIEFPDNIFIFGMRNIPAFRDEEFITSINDYIMKIDFQLAVIHYPNGAKVDVITTWPLLIQNLLKQSEFGIYMKAASRNAEEIVPSLALESKSDLEKTKIITDYVKTNFSWDGFKDKFASQTAKNFQKTKTGNSADINLLLCSMLNVSGIQAYPVLLSTRDHGKIAIDYPYQQFLNYVLVLVRLDNKQLLLDATEPFSPFGMLPARCINEKGLLVNKEKVEWIPITDDVSSEVTDSIYIALNESLDSAHVDIQIQAKGHKALDYRRSYYSDAEGFKEKLLTDDMELSKTITIKHENDIEEPLLINYEATMLIEMAGDKVLISPFPGLTLEKNPLKLSFRAYPVDMIYPETKNYNTVIEIPKGYKFVDQNKSVSIDNSLVTITYKIENTSEKVFVTGSYAFKKAVYLKHEYYDLKNYFTNIVETFNNKIVLAKYIK
jgi:hypothetical protein